MNENITMQLAVEEVFDKFYEAHHILHVEHNFYYYYYYYYYLIIIVIIIIIIIAIIII